MKFARLLLLAALTFFAGLPAFPQSLAKTFTLTGANQCAPIGTSKLPTVGIDVSGTFSLTLTPKVAINGQTPRASQVVPSSSNTPQATITSAGGYTDPFVGGYDNFSLCVTSYSSGSVVIWLNPSPALNGSLFLGGSSGGAVTSVFGRTGAVTAASDDYAGVAAGLNLGDAGGDNVGINTSDGIDMVDSSGDEVQLLNGTVLMQSGVGKGNDSQQEPDGWYSSGVLTSDQHALSTRCEAVGTAANPSVVNCNGSGTGAGCRGTLVSCGGGAFSCDVAASGGTCVVDDSLVCTLLTCTNSLVTVSTIFVSQVADESARLGVTCNSSPVSFMVSSRVNSTSFTITLGSFTTNPVCFDFEIN